MGIIGFVQRMISRGRSIGEKGEEASPPPEPAGPLSSLGISEPLGCLAAEFLFPLAFSAGKMPVRARAIRLAAGPEAFDAGSGDPWFFWKAETPSGKIAGYWRFPPASPPPDEAAAAAWGKTAGLLARFAAARLKESLGTLPALAPGAFAAGPCPEPPLAGKPAFRLDLHYSVAGNFREVSVFNATGYPLLLARALGAELAGLESDPIGAFIAASASFAASAEDAVWTARAFRYRVESGERLYLPVYEFLNLLSDGDLRLIVQNRLVSRLPGDSLGGLFLYLEAAEVGGPSSEKASRGADRLVPPHSLDRDRVYPLFPEAVFSEGRLDAANASPGPDDFLKRNDEVYEDLFRALRGGSLVLSPGGAKLVRELYLSMVYPDRRKRLDALVEANHPAAELSRLPERIARRVVDGSGSRALAIAVFGSADARAFVSKWCSRTKREEMADELKRIEESLAEGTADIDALVAERLAILERAKDIMEKDKRELG